MWDSWYLYHDDVSDFLLKLIENVLNVVVQQVNKTYNTTDTRTSQCYELQAEKGLLITTEIHRSFPLVLYKLPFKIIFKKSSSSFWTDLPRKMTF